jgi:hypothetical protein
MAETLRARQVERIKRGKAVGHEPALEVRTEDLLDDTCAAASRDEIEHAESPSIRQPVSSVCTAGLARADWTSAEYVHGPSFANRTLDCIKAPCVTRIPKYVADQLGDVAVGHVVAVLEVGRESERIGTERVRGDPERQPRRYVPLRRRTHSTSTTRVPESICGLYRSHDRKGRRHPETSKRLELTSS